MIAPARCPAVASANLHLLRVVRTEMDDPGVAFASATQAEQAGEAPILLRVDTDAGHGSGQPVG